jgi:L-2-hydroxyglutarate oxidase
VEGRRELVEFCKTHKVAHDVCGKIVVATDASELHFLEKIYQNGLANQTEGIEKIHSKEIQEIEPFCTTGIAGIWVPCTGIVDFPGVVFKLAELIRQIQPESHIFTNENVSAIQHGESQSRVITHTRTFQGKYLCFCGGLFSDRLAKKDGLYTDSKIVGFRGDYYDLTESGLHKVRNLIYPVPNPAFPFLGVHFTRMIHGGVECGPNAVFTFKREGYKKTDFDIRDSFDALTYRGTWNLFRKHWRFGLEEYKRAFSKQLFLDKLRILIPSLTLEDLTEGRCGVRAMSLAPNGNMIEDFEIEYTHRAIHVLNAPSPAATAGLAIGTEICTMASKKFNWGEAMGN